MMPSLQSGYGNDDYVSIVVSKYFLFCCVQIIYCTFDCFVLTDNSFQMLLVLLSQILWI